MVEVDPFLGMGQSPVSPGSLRAAGIEDGLKSNVFKDWSRMVTLLGLRHALLPPVEDGSSAPCGAEPLPLSSAAPEELRPASGRAGAAVGASEASRTPECGTKRLNKPP
jgi:hypothetical protein